MGTELPKMIEDQALNPEFPYMPKSEWESRIKKARQLMKPKGIDALMILNNDNRLYFFGSAKPYRYVYPQAGIIPLEGPTTLISTGEDSLGVKTQGYVERNIGYRGDLNFPTPIAPDPVKLIAEVIEDIGLANKTIGMEFGPFMWWEGFTQKEWEQLKKELPKVNFVDATDLIWEMRMIKSGWEIEVLRYLYKATSLGYFQMINNARPGKNEMELFYDAVKIWLDMGIIDSTGYKIQCVNAAAPFRNRTLKEGDWILLDGGPSYKGYCADIQRMIFIGNPGKEIRRLASWATRAMETVEGILKPGTLAGDIWMRAMSTVAEGEPDIWRKARSRKFPSWVGHGEGLNLHELPYLVEGSDVMVREGMVLSVEVPSFFEKQIANMPEDVYLVTKDGYEKLTIDFGTMDIYIKT